MESGAISEQDKIYHQKTIVFLEELKGKIGERLTTTAVVKLVKKEYNERLKIFTKHTEEVQNVLSNLFAFCEDVFGEGQEMLIVVTELTANSLCTRFISEFGCDAYFKHNKELLFYERQEELMKRIDELGV